MTPAEKRVKELLDRWLTSLDLHLEYVNLNDSAYNNIQPWPVHDRPSRWVLELAKQKALELQAAFDARLAMGDAKFAESMELMVFLSTLVGIQHVQRYIPLADPQHHGQGTLTELDGLKPVVAKASAPAPPKATSNTTIEATLAMPPRAPATSAPSAPRAPSPTVAHPPLRVKPASVDSASFSNDATQEMPRPAARGAPTTAPQAKSPPSGPPAKPSGPAPAKTAPAAIEAESETHNLVINDAVRLLNWGRPWHELAELIARIADRPKLAEVRRILRSHRAAIELRAAEAQPENEKEK